MSKTTNNFMNKRVAKRLLICLQVLFSKNCFCQIADSNHQKSANKSDLSLELIASILPKAKITRETGNYFLRSHIQSSYDLGLNYNYNINEKTSLATGLHFIVGKRNFFINIPSSDLTNSNPSGLLIEEKELWGVFKIPILIEKKLSGQINPLSIKAGFNLKYSGLMSDESFVATRYDANNRPTDVFYAEISADNNGKPWVTLLGGLFKSILLDNKNILSLGIQTDISTTYFLKSNYEITIPNQPITKGVYKINGSSIGLSVQYTFTGSNRHIIKAQIKDRPNVTLEPQHLKDVFKKYVFKGNHILFNAGLLSTFKAHLTNNSGSHLVNSTAAPGLLFGLKYQINFNNVQSLTTGAEAIFAGRNFSTSFKKDDFSPPLVSDYSSKGVVQDMILCLPIMAQRRWLYSNSKFLFADAGIRVNFSLGADFGSYPIILRNTNNGTYDAGGVDVYENNNAKPWVSMLFNAGHSWVAKNNNLLQLVISSNISFTKYVNGTYQINVPNQPTTQGSYSSKGSFIGLSFNYVFTNANYRIRKANEK